MKNVELNSTWNIFEDLFEIFINMKRNKYPIKILYNYCIKITDLLEIFINIEITCLFKKKFCKKQFYLTIH